MRNKRQFFMPKSGSKQLLDTRKLVSFVCLAVTACGLTLLLGRLPSVNAAIQKAARRVTKTATKAPRSVKAQSTRPSRPARFISQGRMNPDGSMQGSQIITDEGITQTTDELMTNQFNARTEAGRQKPRPEHEYPSRENLPQNPKAIETATWPPGAKQNTSAQRNIHTTGLSFDGATLNDTGAFPPDTMGAVGPTQFITFVNGRLRSFTKAGVADGVLNADADVFFASVMTPVAGSVVLNFTSDPNVRYDRFTNRWFVTIIDVPCTNATCTTTAANRLLMAVSDAASNGTISGSTVWTFFQFQASPGTDFLDYPSLGIDVNALYIGGNMFSSAGSFVGTNGYVVRKSTTLGAGPLTVTMFANLATGAVAGPFAPRGVDNFDATATEGYFVGVDTLTFSTMMFRRVSNPGSATPTISANISVTVPTTTSPNRVEHAGNTGGANGGLDSLDDRLYAAMIRNGRLWTAHNFRVSSAGVANTAAAARNASRWYEFQNLTTTPTVVQSGTVFDNAATRAAARQYFIPSVTVNGQGHAVLGFTMAGTPVGPTPAYVGRLSGDTLGTMNGPPTVAAVSFGTTTANYNPAADPGGASGRRWGDYSFTSVDPLDDMTIWTIQEYNQALNSYAVRVAKLAAPPPATPTCSGSPISFSGPTGNVVINATSSGGSGFYDPGANLAAPALPFNHLSATISNGTVNSVTYNSPTQVTLNITANANGLQNVTLTNPDGQSVTANGCVNVSGIATIPDLAITKTDGVTTAVPGGSVTYTITASNASADPATGATVADTFPATLACSWTCVGAGGGTCTASGSGNINDTVNLPAGASVTYTASCAVNSAATGTLSNTATVTLADDPNAANNSATDTDTLTPQADLGITKTDGVTSATAGGSVTYTITASNVGPSNAPGSTVADTFPASLTCTWTCTGASGGTCTAAGSGNINDTVNLPSGATVTYTASCSISAAATGTLSNTATVATGGGVTDPTPGNNSATDSDTLSASADLSITKTDGVTTATAGGSVTYTITASNAGPSNASGATVADTFPAPLTCTWTCVGAGGGTCTAAGSGNINNSVNLPSGGSVTYTASCSISAGATGTLSNTATVTAPGGVTDPTPGNNSATDTDTLSASADLSITKTDGVATATAGGSVTYTITASNSGPSNAPGSTVADTFPASLTCSWTCVGAGGGTCTAAGAGNINDTVNLPSGGSVTYTASCSISAGASGTLSNTATVATGGGVTDPTPGNNSATDTDTLGASADLAITKTDGVTTAIAGGSVTYTITASNAGPSNASGATVADTFPAPLTCTWTCVGAGGGTCTAAGSGNINNSVNLPSGGSVTYTASCSISAGATGTLSNTATVTAPGGITDPTPGNNSATDTDTLSASADLSITKTDGVTTATAGGSVTYTITASNAGPSNASGATVADTFPAPLTCTWTCVGAGGGTCTAAGSGNINNSVNLPSGGSVTYTASCSISAGASGTLSNTATVATGGGVTDPTPGNNSATDTDTVTCPTITLNPASLPSGQFGVAYSQTLTGSGGVGPYTFALQMGSSLPAGLTLNGMTGLLSGTPTATGSTTFTVLVTDANNCGGNRTYTVGIQCPTITINPASLPNPQIGTAYSQTLTGSGGVGPYTFALHAGSSLPPGLTLLNGVISGTPTALGTTTFTVDVTDTGLAVGPTQCGGNRTYTVTVTCPAITLPPSLANGVQGTAYNQSVAASPAGGNYSYAVTTGSLPPGLSLNSTTGQITGTPTAPNNYAFAITATGFAAGPGGCTKTQSYNLLITGTCEAITLNPVSLPGGTLGTAYNQTVSASPTGTYTFSVTGALPPGLTLNTATGAITGTPTAAGTFSFRLTATATAGGCIGSRVYLVSIGCSTLNFSPASLPNGVAGANYNQAISITPSGTYTFSLLTGSLPPGYSLDTATGLISGATSLTGSFNFTVKAQAGSCQASKSYTLVVNASGTALAQLADYDGDRRSDLALWAQNGTWRIVNAANQQGQTLTWGTAGDIALLGDYDGDGKTDLAVFRPSNGTWYVKRSTNGSFLIKVWGASGDIPVPGDYDGDSKTDFAVWRPGDGNWYIWRSSDQQFEVTAWGSAAAAYKDVTVPGDYDGDGKTDLAVFRRATGTWLIKLSSNGQAVVKAWGTGTDVPAAADYDGDGKTDFAFWRPQSGTWYVWQSTTNNSRQNDWGIGVAPYNDQIAQGDYDGDNQADLAVWRAADQTWYILCSHEEAVMTKSYGRAGDLLVGKTR